MAPGKDAQTADNLLVRAGVVPLLEFLPEHVDGKYNPAPEGRLVEKALVLLRRNLAQGVFDQLFVGAGVKSLLAPLARIYEGRGNSDRVEAAAIGKFLFQARQIALLGAH